MCVVQVMAPSRTVVAYMKEQDDQQPKPQDQGTSQTLEGRFGAYIQSRGLGEERNAAGRFGNGNGNGNGNGSYSNGANGTAEGRFAAYIKSREGGGGGQQVGSSSSSYSQDSSSSGQGQGRFAAYIKEKYGRS